MSLLCSGANAYYSGITTTSNTDVLSDITSTSASISGCTGVTSQIVSFTPVYNVPAINEDKKSGISTNSTPQLCIVSAERLTATERKSVTPSIDFLTQFPNVFPIVYGDSATYTVKLEDVSSIIPDDILGENDRCYLNFSTFASNLHPHMANTTHTFYIGKDLRLPQVATVKRENLQNVIISLHSKTGETLPLKDKWEIILSVERV